MTGDDDWVLIKSELWHQYTSLPKCDYIVMAWPKRLIIAGKTEDQAVEMIENFCDRLSFNVLLLCIFCRSQKGFRADTEQDAGEDDSSFQLRGLDDRMEPWIKEHAACRYQAPLPLVYAPPTATRRARTPAAGQERLI